MNWASYLVNELEKDYREARDLGYEFHFSWLIILIAYVACQMTKGATFLGDRTIRAHWPLGFLPCGTPTI
jgi:hypothetical protein